MRGLGAERGVREEWILVTHTLTHSWAGMCPVILRPVNGNKSNSPVFLDTNFGLGICRKNQRRGWGHKECYFHQSHGLKIMVVASTDVVRSVGASGSSEAEALALSHTLSFPCLSLTHSLTHSVFIWSRESLGWWWCWPCGLQSCY